MTDQEHITILKKVNSDHVSRIIKKSREIDEYKIMLQKVRVFCPEVIQKDIDFILKKYS